MDAIANLAFWCLHCCPAQWVPPFLYNQEELLLICWGDWHKTCVGEIPLVPKARWVLAVVLVHLLWCWLHTEHHPRRNCLLVFLVLVKSPVSHLLQAVVNNVLLDKVLTQCHTSPLTARMFLMVPQRIVSINSLQLSVVFMNPHLAVHLSCICGDCYLVCSQS